MYILTVIYHGARDHIQYIEGKVARALDIMIKAGKVFHAETLKTLYFTFVYPYFTYCIEVWGNTCCSYLDPLAKLQNRAIRFITGCGIRAHLFPLYKDLRLLSLSKIYLCILFVYKRHHDLLPNMFYSLFPVKRDITGRDGRQYNLLHVPKDVLSVRRRTILFSRVSLHNFFFDRISYEWCIYLILQMPFEAIYKLVLFTSQYSLVIYLLNHILRGLTWFFRGPIYSPWGSRKCLGWFWWVCTILCRAFT